MEIMIAVSILTVGIMAFISTFTYITKSIHVSRARSLATNLVQEKIENLRNISYPKLMITTQTVTWTQLDRPLSVDALNYPPEEIRIGGITFHRGVWITFAQMQGNSMVDLSIDYPDTGMKNIMVMVAWAEGNVWKYVLSESLYENPTLNPLSASRIGAVWDGVSDGPVIPGARVKVMEHPDWSDFAGTDGSYLIQAQAGTYTLRVSSQGYTDALITGVTLSSSGAPGKTNFVLTKIATGSVSGNLWMNTGLVISQVVSSSLTHTGVPVAQDVEYVELFNPTTYTIDIVQGLSKKVLLDYRCEQSGNNKSDANFNFTYVNDSVGPGKYYLFANAPDFWIDGTLVTADAYYSGNYNNQIVGGCFRILNAADNTVIDQVGWVDEHVGSAPCYEGHSVPYNGNGDGISQGDQLVRVSSPGLASDVYGRAYDSGDNELDFLYPYHPSLEGVNWNPHSSAEAAQTIITGKPAAKALIASNDTIGASTDVYTAYVTSDTLQLPYAAFKLDNVAVGTWDVIAASGVYQWKTEGVTVAADQTTAIPNTRAGVPDAGQVSLDTYTISGYLAGRITDESGNALCVTAQAGGGTCACTSGMFFCYDVSTGPIIAMFNPNNADGQHVEFLSAQTIETGLVNSLNVELPTGGTLRGFVGTDATTSLANITVSASKSGVVYGSAVTDSTGYYHIKNLAADTYTVAPVLDPLMASNPPNRAATPSAGTTTDVDPFVVSGAGGIVTGHIYYPAGTPVTTGAIVLVSTASIGSSPPSIFASSAAAQAVYYAASSLADGSYAVEVRGYTTPNVFHLSVFYPNVSGTSMCVTTATVSGLTILPSGETPQDITFTSICH